MVEYMGDMSTRMAFIHESLTRLGGAERVLAEMHHLFPRAPIYAILHEDRVVKTLLSDADMRLSHLRRLPRFMKTRERLLTPFLPVIPESFDLSEYQIVVSSASAFAKGVVTRPGTLHICYCHSPTRYLWDWHANSVREQGKSFVTRIPTAFLLHILRMWDVAAAARVDRFIANSHTTAARIRKYYARESDVIYPPVNVDRFSPGTGDGQYFLIVSRLSPYKYVDLAVSVFNKLELPLVVAGEGRDRKRLERMAGKNITFLGFVPEHKLPSLYAGARAVLFPGEDDFGIVPVEAFASGRPVIALRRGGATETVVEHVTGEFFDEPHEAMLAEAVRQFLTREEQYRPDVIRAHAQQFSASRFRSELNDFVWRAWEEWQREGRKIAPAHHAAGAEATTRDQSGAGMR